MRAVLLVKDKEGLTDDRLNGRYGLTGKPTLAQQGIAGSLSASFKAGQGVAMANLRSLNEKIREAQKALQSAQGNLGATDDTLDDMENERDKAQQLIGSGLWERMWRGIIDPFSFFAAKVMEDESYKLMAGEPGYPVIDEMPFRATAPICRVPYWDPILSNNVHSMNVKKAEHIHAQGQDFIAFTEYTLSAILVRSEDISDLLMTVRGLETAMQAMITIIGVIVPLLMMKKNPDAKAMLLDFLPAQAQSLAISVALSAMMALLQALLNGHIEEFGGTPGRGQTLLQAPAFYQNTNWTNYLYLDPLVGSIMSAVVSTITTASGLMSSATLLTITSWALENVPYPAAQAVAAALDKVAYAIEKKAWVLFVGGYVQIYISCSLLALIITSRNNGRKIPSMFGGLETNIEMQKPDEMYGNPLWACTGYLTQFSDDIEGANAFLTALQQMNKYLSVADPTRPYLAQVLVKIDNTLMNVNWAITEMKGNQSRVAKYNPNVDENISFKRMERPILEDWYGTTYPQIKFDFNDVAAGVKGTGYYPPTSYISGNIDMRATVYDYDYFGAARKIKLFERAIDRTVVIRAKSSSDDSLGANESIEEHSIGGGIWYGICVLVRFAGDAKLYLLWERNAQFDARYREWWRDAVSPDMTGDGSIGSSAKPGAYLNKDASGLPHAEQMIYNYDRSALPNAKPITSTRQGALEYYYCEYETEDSSTLIQFRPVASRKENWLAGQLINTEYVFGGDIALIYPPNHGSTEGDISSYAQQR